MLDTSTEDVLSVNSMPCRGPSPGPLLKARNLISPDPGRYVASTWSRAPVEFLDVIGEASPAKPGVKPGPVVKCARKEQAQAKRVAQVAGQFVYKPWSSSSTGLA